METKFKKDIMALAGLEVPAKQSPALMSSNIKSKWQLCRKTKYLTAEEKDYRGRLIFK